MKEEFLKQLENINLQKIKDKSIFMSYGHDAFLPYAKRLAKDLETFVKKVWFDEACIREKHEWDLEIEDGISSSDTVIALMTKHAYRRPSGVCLKEVVFASNGNKDIVPVMVERITMPLLLCNIQYVDVCDIYDIETQNFDEEKYYDTLKRLLICLETDEAELQSNQTKFKKFFQPVDNQIEISMKTKGFVGRKWLIDEFENWLALEESNIYLLLGGPGTGKSSFSAYLTMTSEAVKAIHFCNYNEKHSGNLKTVIRTIAYYLSVQIEEYSNYLETLVLEDVINYNDTKLFKTLIIEPLKHIANKEKVVIVIDALDEMNKESLNLFLQLLEQYYDEFPKWFYLVLTARKNPQIEACLQKIQSHIIDTQCEENKQDLRNYLHANLDERMPLTEGQIELILEKSEGVFQYIVHIIENIKSQKYTLFEQIVLPQGLAGLYTHYFQRCFTDKEAFVKVRPVLEVMCAAQKTLEGETIETILKSPYAVTNAQLVLGDYIWNRDGKIMFFHKSIKDWLTDKYENTIFYTNPEQGHAQIATWVEENIDEWEENPYLYNHGFYHLFKAKKYEAIYNALNQQSDIYCNSFCGFIEDILMINQSTARLFKGMKRYVDNLEFVICMIIRNMCDKGVQEEFIYEIIDEFSDCYEWLEEYYLLKKHLLNGEIQKVLEVGEPLLEKIEHKEVKLKILDYIGDSYRLLGNHEKAFESYEKVLAGYPEREWSTKCFISVYNYYDLRYVKGFLKEAEIAITKFGRRLPDKSFNMYKMWRLKGNIYYQSGRREEAIECFRHTLEIAEYERRKLYIAEANYSIAEALVGYDNSLAEEHIEKAREIGRQIHSKTIEARSHFAEVELFVDRKQWDAVIASGKVGAQLLEETKYLTGAARVKQSMAIAYFAKEDYAAAEEMAMFVHNRFKVRNSYPVDRIKAWKLLMLIGEKTGKLKKMAELDYLENIPNLEEFHNLDTHIEEIRRLLKKADGE